MFRLFLTRGLLGAAAVALVAQMPSTAFAADKSGRFGKYENQSGISRLPPQENNKAYAQNNGKKAGQKGSNQGRKAGAKNQRKANNNAGQRKTQNQGGGLRKFNAQNNGFGHQKGQYHKGKKGKSNASNRGSGQRKNNAYNRGGHKGGNAYNKGQGHKKGQGYNRGGHKKGKAYNNGGGHKKGNGYNKGHGHKKGHGYYNGKRHKKGHRSNYYRGHKNGYGYYRGKSYGNHGHYNGGYYRPVSARTIRRILRSFGFYDIAHVIYQPHRHRYLARAYDPYGDYVKVALSAYNGEIIGLSYVYAEYQDGYYGY